MKALVDWILKEKLGIERACEKPNIHIGFSHELLLEKLFYPFGWIVDSMTFKYRRKITITEQSGNDLTDYQVLVELNSTNFNFEHTQTNGEDIRFTDGNGNLLDYWIESWDAVNESAKVWVKVPSIPANSSVEIFLYYGNEEVTDASDGEATFEFFDDFEDYTEKWQEGGDSPTVSSETVDGRSVVKITNGGSNCGGIETKQNINVENRVIERMVKGWTTADNGDADECICIDTAWKASLWCSDNLMHGLFDLKEYVPIEKHGLKIGGNGDVSLGSESLSTVEWQKVITIIETGKITGICRDEEISQTGTPSTYEGKLMLSVDNNQNNAGIYYDWLFVRKYTEPEPSVSLGAEETA